MGKVAFEVDLQGRLQLGDWRGESALTPFRVFKWKVAESGNIGMEKQTIQSDWGVARRTLVKLQRCVAQTGAWFPTAGRSRPTISQSMREDSPKGSCPL
jgi:hypothetical protein